MIARFRPYRLASVFPLLILGLAAVVGGWLNGVEMRGRVVDDLTSEGIAKAAVAHGARAVTADDSGNFVFPNLPRESLVRIDAPGYLRKSAAPTEEEIRLNPLSFTVQVNEAGNPDKHIAGAEIRQGDKALGTTGAGGNTVISSPYPGKDAKLLICAKGYDQKEITAHGVVGTFELTPGTSACPPLPTPTPAPSPSASPSTSPGASPTATPSPTASP